MQQQAFKILEEAKREADNSYQPFEQEDSNGLDGYYDEPEQLPAIPAQTLIDFNAELLSLPEGSSLNPKLARLLQCRATTIGSDGAIDCVHAPNSLVLWEAQFGDFANVAQSIIDQFIASGRSKWKQQSSLVLLLPHGYEGQGPDHSSARLERYLELSALDNWRVANCSTSAQYFHLLRSQAFNLLTYPGPLVVMTSKSLLRHPLAAASLQELIQETFQPVLDDRIALSHADAVRRMVLCTGKIAIDMLANKLHAQAQDVAIVRVEMLYPFPAEALKKALANYPEANEVVWVQEEPLNMGAWSYISSQLSMLLDQGIELNVIARPTRPSPATGFSDLFQFEQEQIIEGALRTTVNQYGGKHGG